MTTQRKSNGRAKGSALVTVMVVTVVVCALVATVMAVSLQNTHSARRLSDRAKAQAIAEAGVWQAYSVLRTNFAARSNANMFPNTPYGGGSYARVVTPIENSNALIVCTGTYNSATVCVAADCKNYGPATGGGGGGGLTDLGAANGCVFYTEGSINYTASGRMQGGTVHANGGIVKTGPSVIDVTTWETCGDFTNKVSIGGFKATNLFVGGNANIQGTGWTVDTVRVSTKLTLTGVKLYSQDVDCKTASLIGGGAVLPAGALSTNQNYPGPTPTGLDQDLLGLNLYQAEAARNLQVYDGDVTVPGSYCPTGGIMWVNGNLTIQGAGAMTGCYIATGSIRMPASKGGNIVKYANYPVLVSTDGNVEIYMAGEVRGLVYARTGAVTVKGSGSIYGQVLSRGNMDPVSGTWNFIYQDSRPTPPGGSGGGLGPDNIGLSAWQK